MGRWFGGGWALVAIAAGAVTLGVVAGLLFTRGSPERFSSSEALVEIQLTDGSVYVGLITDEQADRLFVEGPAVVLPQGSGQSRTYLVQPLSRDPYSVEGSIVMMRDAVAFIGRIIPGSAIERAYRDAMNPASSSSPAAS